MKQCLMIAPWKENMGPSNVIRELKQYSCEGEILYLYQENKLLRYLEAIIRIIQCKTIISSPISSLGILAFRIGKLLNKKCVCLIHGCVANELEVNHIENPALIKMEKKGLELSDSIILVSEYFMNWMKEFYPKYANKMYYVNNGFNLSVREKNNKAQYTIAVMGGNIRIKRNLSVCKAVQYLNQKYNCNYRIYIYGTISSNGEKLPTDNSIILKGHLKQSEMYSELDKVNIFVVNSSIESFGLAVGDALNCRCSILLSSNVGFRSIIQDTEVDIINDGTDYIEIAKKILLLTEKENWNRIVNSINTKECSVTSAKNKLLELCK